MGSRNAHATPTLRVACYNIEADIDGYTTPRDGLYTVLEAIGEQPYAGTAAQPLDLLALEETTSNGVVGTTPSNSTGTVAPIVSALNAYYNGAATYAVVPYQATEYNNDPSTGNGPSAMIYNTTTLTLVYQNGAAAVGVAGTAVKSGGNTVYRQVPRYEFQPRRRRGGHQFLRVRQPHEVRLQQHDRQRQRPHRRGPGHPCGHRDAALRRELPGDG